MKNKNKTFEEKFSIEEYKDTFETRFMAWAFAEKDEKLALTGTQAQNVLQFFLQELKDIVGEIEKRIMLLGNTDNIDNINKIMGYMRDEWAKGKILGYDEAIQIIKSRIK